MDNRERLNYITLLSVISCFAVIMLHINGCFWGNVKEEYWISANIIECLFYFGVPCFLMISGTTLIDYRERYTTKEYFKKRVFKTLIPYIIWSFVALIYRLGMGEISPSNISFSFVMNGLINGQMLGIYWFFPVLFIMYLVIPIIAYIPKENRMRVLQYTIIIGFIICSLVPFILNVAGLNLIVWPYVSSYLVGPFIYVALGYVIKNIEISKIKKIIIYILGIAGFLTHCMGTYFLSTAKGELVQLFKGYYTPICYFYALAIFVLIKEISKYLMKGRFKSFTEFVGQYTFSIYLTHYFIMQVVLQLFMTAFHVDGTSIAYRLTAIFFIVPIIILLTWIVRKIPILKHTVPK